VTRDAINKMHASSRCKDFQQGLQTLKAARTEFQAK